MQKHKIINDPVHGFIEIPKGVLLELIDTEQFQRLRRIRQLALSSLVYPGAIHSRFNHCIGAMFLTAQALDVLRQKGNEITDQEYESTLMAILLHDIGHGPFSHALENVILPGLHHERMSKAIMGFLNLQFKGRLDTAMEIFEGNYPKQFLHQLVSSQLDMDRMDYLVRDSYFTGVVEGLVSVDRIIKTLDVRENKLVVEAKGIYSVEKFIVARRLMYWQVYLHRAVLAAEYMIVNILQRARYLMNAGKPIWTSAPLQFFFTASESDFVNISAEVIDRYTQLDDEDILYAIKQWQHNEDQVLAFLCKGLLNRRLLKARFRNGPIPAAEVDQLKAATQKRLGIPEEAVHHLVFTGEVSNLAYLSSSSEPIIILHKNGQLEDISSASDMANIEALSKPVNKWFLCFPEGMDRDF